LAVSGDTLYIAGFFAMIAGQTPFGGISFGAVSVRTGELIDEFRPNILAPG